MTNRSVALLAASCLIAGALLTRFYWPAVETKLEVQEKEVIRKQIETRVVHVKQPDGTERTETVIIDNSIERRDSKLSYTKVAQKQYLVGAGVQYEWGRFQAPEYSLVAGRRIVGPVFGVLTLSKERVQVSGLVEF